MLVPEGLIHAYHVVPEEEEEGERGGGATERNVERSATRTLAALWHYLALLGETWVGFRSPGEALPAGDNSIS